MKSFQIFAARYHLYKRKNKMNIYLLKAALLTSGSAQHERISHDIRIRIVENMKTKEHIWLNK